MQMRQLPGTDRCGCQQKYGMKKPFALAACITVWSSSAWTGWPLMKNSIMKHRRTSSRPSRRERLCSMKYSNSSRYLAMMPTVA